MKIKAINILIFITLITPFSCSEWIELIPPQGLIREEFWQTKEDVQAVIMGAYESFAQLDEMLFKYGEIRADMVVGDYNQDWNEQRISEGNIYPDNWLCDWSEFYKVINYCNEVIKNAPLVQENDDTFSDYLLQGYLSEVYFLRSLSYFYLVRIFKDVPFVTAPTESDDADFYLEKSDGEEILASLIADLEEARKYATTDGYQTLEELKGRATKAAIDALLADISLWLFDYEAVLRHVANIESNPDYVLMPSAKWFELYYPGNSLESIFEFQFDDDLNQRNSLYGLTRRYSYQYDPSQKAIEMFAKEFTRELYRGEDSSIKKYGESDFIIWKYVGSAPDGETTRSGSDQNSANWIVYRMADILLMKAEALSQMGRFPEALSIINEIRFRADVPAVSIPNSETAFEDAIMEERALELAFEGKRWFDLMRMGRRNNYARKSKLIEVIVKNVPSTQKRILATKLTNPLGWYMPIYESEIDRNKNLIQNPYYIN
ncbi:MAG: RagB/SusD family nutrient uptake outer membrane protein [Bacteroidota bacterium]